MAFNLGIERVILKYDCQTLIDACNKKITIWELRDYIQDFASMGANMMEAHYSWVDRKKNEAAYFVARMEA